MFAPYVHPICRVFHRVGQRWVTRSETPSAASGRGISPVKIPIGPPCLNPRDPLDPQIGIRWALDKPKRRAARMTFSAPAQLYNQ
eukprot:9478305-Pyramimonas_sp.AAC.1